MKYKTSATLLGVVFGHTQLDGQTYSYVLLAKCNLSRAREVATGVSSMHACVSLAHLADVAKLVCCFRCGLHGHFDQRHSLRCYRTDTYSIGRGGVACVCQITE